MMGPSSPEIRGKRFTVVGAARSGLAVMRLLKSRGAEVFVSEKSAAEAMLDVRTLLTELRVESEFGQHSGRALDAETLVLSPGVRSDAPIVQKALASGRQVVSELEVASWFWNGPLVAITGTNGKTTTAALVGRIFSDAKIPSVVAGNIGVAFSQVVEEGSDRTTAIVEVSSFQLDHIERFRPTVAVLLNITPDHLDRYGESFEQYVASKCRIFRNQRAGDTLVYCWDDETVRACAESQADRTVKLLPFSQRRKLKEGAFVVGETMSMKIDGEEVDLLARKSISIPGTHNLYNAMAATLVACVQGVSVASIRSTLRNFKGVEHRLEFVREVNGIRFVNDSKATNVESVWYALQSYTAPIVLLLGGRDKGNDYARLRELVRSRVRTIVAIGESAEKVYTSFKDVVPVSTAKSMDEAVQIGADLAHPGDIVLLSPACASFDWFRDYEHRGQVFKAVVMTLRRGS